MEREKKYNHLLENLKVPEGLSTDQAWEKLNARIQANPSTTKVIPLWKKLSPAVGVAAAIALIFWIGTGSSGDVFVQSENNRLEQVLPDGSKVYLNKFSELSYSENNWADNRKVELKGEAYFEVAKGSTFTVESQGKRVSVLGTSFNIFARDEFYDVDCYTGKVKVENEFENIILSPGLSTSLIGVDLIDPFSINSQQPDWKRDEFSFDDVEVKRVFEEIENEFNVSIDYNNVEEMFFTGTFKISTLQQALDVVCLALGLDFEVDGKKVYIKM